MKYIYFEHHWYKYTDGSGKETHSIENYNVLLNKPHTNSGGLWGHNFITEHKSGRGLPWYNHIVDQYWIDLEKYDLNETSKDKDTQLVKDALDKLNYKSIIRDSKLEKLLD